MFSQFIAHCRTQKKAQHSKPCKTIQIEAAEPSSPAGDKACPWNPMCVLLKSLCRFRWLYILADDAAETVIISAAWCSFYQSLWGMVLFGLGHHWFHLTDDQCSFPCLLSPRSEKKNMLLSIFPIPAQSLDSCIKLRINIIWSSLNK